MDAYSPSLLDKLLAPDHEGRPGQRLQFSKDRIKDSVARDIEMLLNCHAPMATADAIGLPHVCNSFLTLGLTDIGSLSLSSDRDRARITEGIRTALARHDRRLSHVDVSVSQGTDPDSNHLVFSIKARLTLRPDVDSVSFDAVLQPGSSRYEVVKADRRKPS